MIVKDPGRRAGEIIGYGIGTDARFRRSLVGRPVSSSHQYRLRACGSARLEILPAIADGT